MSLLKASLLFLAAFSAHIALTPPMPPPNPNEIRKDVSAGEKIFGSIIRSITGLTKLVIWAGALCEIAVILAHEYPDSLASYATLTYLIWSPTSSVDRISINPIFLLGWLAAILSGYFRVQCFRALGRLFTYEITIRDSHQLITHGPYSVVRHPAYTSLMLGFIGIAVSHGCHGSWFRECGFADTLTGKLVGYGYLLSMVYGIVSMTLRTPQEDQLLRKEFGDQWVNWARRVPYKLVPYVY
ncbi:hypothetical protein WOLCODRAFT_166081 [Wolfiporia cocos MD-104 SS10]|uniref:Uncharacterized protein n=1 Tax=Wolfiporia cocos (strain MD-104) TaxID=742152 RepID=A0A2H3JBW4_WOLCO|nr:hypothetical protein WOLCODRAFT_166081 [Wolfiporia cocos MD-104 SS10]